MFQSDAFKNFATIFPNLKAFRSLELRYLTEEFDLTSTTDFIMVSRFNFKIFCFDYFFKNYVIIIPD